MVRPLESENAGGAIGKFGQQSGGKKRHLLQRCQPDVALAHHRCSIDVPAAACSGWRIQHKRRRPALGLAGGGYTPGFVLPTTQATFKVKRYTDGNGYLEVPGQTPEIVPRAQLLATERSGFPTLEFGSDGTGQVSISEWFALGLPPLVPTVARQRWRVS